MSYVMWSIKWNTAQKWKHLNMILCRHAKLHLITLGQVVRTLISVGRRTDRMKLTGGSEMYQTGRGIVIWLSCSTYKTSQIFYFLSMYRLKIWQNVPKMCWNKKIIVASYTGGNAAVHSEIIVSYQISGKLELAMGCIVLWPNRLNLLKC
jgi:hypothetical protein